jgi:serine/threonine-protein kinase
MTPQSTIAHYRITSKLGEGGMGEVWRATDTKLNRDVAIKVLPDSFANDPDRLARFGREAQVLASLNHPNIAAIYGVEERALVMELVEGPTLAERLMQGRVPLDEALPIAKQIAEALEYAHEKGVVHRDLKPANVKVTPEGRVKVLDFGLAALTQSSPAGGRDPTSSPTLTMRATQAGTIIGTASYMSPEQAAGKALDRRTDIWSFGVVLWEMLTGRRLFDGETVSETLADLLRRDIDFKALPAGMPPAIRYLLGRCLDRNPRNRLRDIGEARVAIDRIGEGREEPATATAQSSTKLPWILAAVAAFMLGCLGVLYWWTARPVLRPLQRFDVEFTPPERVHPFLALRPDGAQIAFVAKDKDGVARIHARTLDQAEATAVAGTDNAVSPFFSPDGQWLGFGADGSLKKILAQGGTAVRICDAPDLRGGSWGEDGYIVFAPSNISGLYRVSQAGGTPEQITKLKSGERTHRFPQVLPGARAVLFTAGTSPANQEDATLQVVDLASGQVRTLHQGGFYGRYLPSGHLLWAHEFALFAAAVDIGRTQLKESPIPVLDRLADDPGSALGNFEVASAGTIAAITGPAQAGRGALSWLDQQGTIRPLSVPPADYRDIRLSPDGKRVALSIQGATSVDIFVCELEGERLLQLTFTGNARNPVWTPDGKHIVFQQSDAKAIYWIRADGRSQPELLLTATGLISRVFLSAWSPDGKQLLFFSPTTQTTGQLWTVSVNPTDPEHPKTGTPQPLPQSSERGGGSISPDGLWLAYVPPGPPPWKEIYIESFPPTGGRWRIPSGAGGGPPRWAQTTRELFFVGTDGRIMTASYRVNGNSFVAEKPHVWVEKPVKTTISRSLFDITPDGKRAIGVFTLNENTADTHLTFLLNFTDELRRRAK